MLGSLDANGKTQNTYGSNSGCKWCMRSSLSDMCCLLLGQFRGTVDVSLCTSAPIIGYCDFNLTSSTAANLLLTVGCSLTTGGMMLLDGSLGSWTDTSGLHADLGIFAFTMAPTLLLFHFYPRPSFGFP
jgi:hypothetical protein